MKQTEFSELCESIGLVPASLYIPGSRDGCLYQLPVDLENPMKNYSSVMTSYSKSFGYISWADAEPLTDFDFKSYLM